MHSTIGMKDSIPNPYGTISPFLDCTLYMYHDTMMRGKDNVFGFSDPGKYVLVVGLFLQEQLDFFRKPFFLREPCRINLQTVDVCSNEEIHDIACTLVALKFPSNNVMNYRRDFLHKKILFHALDIRLKHVNLLKY